MLSIVSLFCCLHFHVLFKDTADVYFRHLLVSPKDRRVVIVESLLCPTVFRETLAKVFFRHFEVCYAI
jgi:actin-related protein 10